MPYIKKEDRINITSPNSVGELNYMISMIALSYLENKGLNYQTINDIIGAFDCAKNEFYRRAAVPYENEKIKTNGDIY
jgi:hypothetical protein